MDEATSTVTTPTQVGTATDWTDISVGNQHTCGLKAGVILCMGRNTSGELGLPADSDQHPTPTAVGGDADWVDLTAGLGTTCGVKMSGALYCWGDNASGQLGLEDFDDRDTPTRVGTATDWASLGTSFYTSICGLKVDGALYCWGVNSSGQLGDGTTTAALAPVRVGVEVGWTAVSQGFAFAGGIRDGQVYFWGGTSNSRLGGSVPDDTVLKPVGSGTGWTDVDVGSTHACGVKDTELFCWGDNNFGQLGDGTKVNRLLPRLIDTNWEWTAVALGSWHSCALRSTGIIYCFGRNNSGQLGKNHTDDTEFNYEPNPSFGTQGWATVSAGGNGACALRGGQPYCWGGYTLLNQASAQTVVGTGTAWSQIETGGLHACGINGSNVACFGYNLAGQVGSGDGLDKSAPVAVGGAGGWTEVVVSSYGTCGVRSGALNCWGSYGLGSANTPAPIGGTNWSKLQAGGEYFCGYRGSTPVCFGGRFNADIAEITPANVTDLTPDSWGICGLVDGALYCMRHVRVEPSGALVLPPVN